MHISGQSRLGGDRIEPTDDHLSLCAKMAASVLREETIYQFGDWYRAVAT